MSFNIKTIKEIKIIIGSVLIKIIELFITYLKSKCQTISETMVDKPEYNFLDLAPDENGKGFETYYNALNWALLNKNISNLALTGPYGSGKSSILRSFEKIYPNYHFLWISLASFNDKEISTSVFKEVENSDHISNKEILEQKIELSIFQQLFYHEKNTNVPDSRFKRINNIKTTTILTKALVIVLWFLAIVALFKIKFIQETVFWDYLYQTCCSLIGIFSLEEYHKLIFSIFSFFLFISITFYGVVKLIRILNNSNINKLKIQNTEIEINPKVNISILNKYLDEILYFFEVTQSKVVVIEDLDRFNNHEIFIKLRELNSLINKSRQVNKRIVFLYAIKDDMFINNEDRTKFFDYMIPVIPVVNSSNSGELFKDYLKDEIKSVYLPNGLTSNFIDEISKFVEDMRLLKSVCNEYFIYKDRLRGIKDNLEKDKLFSIILYKNMYPTDFVQLHINKGIVYDAFKNKHSIIKSFLDTFDCEINSIHQKINNLNSIQIVDIKELRSIYINEIRNQIKTQINNPTSLVINGLTVEFESLVDDIHFNELIENSNIKYNSLTFHQLHNRNIDFYRSESLNSNKTFKSIEDSVDNSFSYKEREKLIYDRNNHKIESLKQEIELIKSKKNKIQNKSLNELSKLQDISNQLPSEKLLKYLLINGLINENYHYYISYFYEGSLTRTDNDFLLNVISQTPTNYDYELIEIGNLSNTIDVRYYYTFPILNYNLVDFILINSKYEYIKPIFNNLLNSENKKAIEFIDGFIDNGINKDIFISELTLCWSGFWKFIEHKTMFTDKRLNIYLKLIILNAEIEDIKKQSISDYINNSSDFLSIFTFGEGLEKIRVVLQELNIKFKKIEYNNDATDLLQFIYENNMYEINIFNIMLFAQNIENSESDDLKTANYTTIQQTKSGCLKEYVEKNIENYISSVFLKLSENTQESESVTIKLLNNPEISNSNKVKIIQKVDFILSNLDEIKDFEIQKILFQNDKVCSTWDNIISYFDILNSENEIKKNDDILIAFLNKEKNYESLVVDEYNSLSSLDNYIESFVVEDKISDNCFEKIIGSIAQKWDSLSFEKLSKRKVEFLIKNGNLNITDLNFSILGAYFEDLGITLLEQSPDKFISSISIFDLYSSDVLAIMNSTKFTDTQKYFVIKYFIDKKQLDVITDDDELTKYAILYLTTFKDVLDSDLLTIFINLTEIVEIKIMLLNNSISALSEVEITNILKIIGDEYAKITNKEGQQKLEVFDYNHLLIENLKLKGFISPGSGYIKHNKLRIHHFKK